jgi:hypothetical protein
MTHISESEFGETVRAWLTHHYAEEDVDEEVVLPSGRRADFVVETPIGRSLAVEVENSRWATYEAVGQALAYQNELCDRRGKPYAAVVIVPTHAVEELGAGYLTQEVEFVEVSPTWSPP